jgi:predicted transcriptional regulator
LIAPSEILDDIAPKYEITKKQLENHLKNIVLDGYIDFSNSDDNKGKMLYVITLSTRGEAFKRERDDRVKRRWRDLGWKVILAGVAFVVAYILGLMTGK